MRFNNIDSMAKQCNEKMGFADHLAAVAHLLELECEYKKKVPAVELFRIFDATNKITDKTKLYFHLKSQVESGKMTVDQAVEYCETLLENIIGFELKHQGVDRDLFDLW